MNYLPILLFLVVTAAPVLMNSPANPSSWSSSSAWSPASTSLRGLPAGTLQAWYDANSPANKVAFLSLGDNVNMAGLGWSYAAIGNVNSNVLVFNNSYLTAYFGNNNVLSVYPQIQLGADANVYQLVGMLSSNTFAVSPNLKATYVNQSVHVNSVIGVSDLSGNGRHLYSSMSLSNLSPFIYVGEQAGYFTVPYYPSWINGQPMTGWVSKTSVTPYYPTVNGPFCLGEFNLSLSWAGPISEVVMTNTALSTTQRQQLEGYLAAKWGLQNFLPTSHPYASSSPNGFTPLSFSPNLVQWYDSNNAGSLFTDSGCSIQAVSGNTIGCLTDQSGNGRPLLQSNGSQRPTYNVAVLGGNLPALNANFGSQNSLCSAGNATWLSNTNTTTVLVGQLGQLYNSGIPFFVGTQYNPYQQNNSVACGVGFGSYTWEIRLLYTQYSSDYSYQLTGAPFFNANSQNSLSGLYYINNAYASSASMDTNTAAYLNNAPYTVAVVAKTANASFIQNILGTSYPINGAVTDGVFGIWWASLSSLRINQWYDDYNTSGISLTANTTLYVANKSAPSVVTVRINGSTVSGSGGFNYLTAVSGYFTLGQLGSPGFNGYIYETIVLTGTLKTAHLTMLEGYLVWKWGLQSQLPRNHPYRLVPPRK